MNKYVEVAYQEKGKPFGEYPSQLAKYLVKRFQMREGMRSWTMAVKGESVFKPFRHWL